MPGQQIDRTINVVSQAPLRAGVSPKTNKPYTLYDVATDVPVLDDGGTPCVLRAFGLMTHNQPIDVTLEVYASATGERTWTVKPKDRKHVIRPHSAMPKSNMQAQPPTPVGAPLRLDSRLHDLESRLQDLERKKESLQAEVDDSYAQIASLNHKIDTLTNLLAPAGAQT